MNLTAALRKSLSTSPIVAAVAYAGLVFVLVVLIVTSIVDILGQQAAVASSAAMLEQPQGRRFRPATRRRPDAIGLGVSGRGDGHHCGSGPASARRRCRDETWWQCPVVPARFAGHAIQGGICQHGRELRNRSAGTTAADLRSRSRNAVLVYRSTRRSSPDYLVR